VSPAVPSSTRADGFKKKQFNMKPVWSVETSGNTNRPTLVTSHSTWNLNKTAAKTSNHEFQAISAIRPQIFRCVRSLPFNSPRRTWRSTETLVETKCFLLVALLATCPARYTRGATRKAAAFQTLCLPFCRISVDTGVCRRISVELTKMLWNSTSIDRQKYMGNTF
jgi:hypothetical protein